MKLIQKYFPNLTGQQTERFVALFDLYRDWNEKINVISRKDIDQIYLRHVLHSLAIAKFIRFTPQTKLIDVGTGGGFPAIPLAIMFPDCEFMLLDSIGKKIRVASSVAESLGLSNCRFANKRMEQEQGKYDFILSRAAMSFTDLVGVSAKNISATQRNAMPNGIIALKGGDLEDELRGFKLAEVTEISQYFEEDFFETKKIVYFSV